MDKSKPRPWGQIIVITALLLLLAIQLFKKLEQHEVRRNEMIVPDSLLCEEMRRQGAIPSDGDCVVPREGFDLQNLFPLPRPKPAPDLEPLFIPREGPPAKQADLHNNFFLLQTLEEFYGELEFSPLSPLLFFRDL